VIINVCFEVFFMKMKKLTYAIAGISLTSFAAGSAMAGPSAKFAAVYSNSPSLTSAVIITDATVDTVVDMTTTGHTLATIKVPQQKELLVGLSAEIGLMTDTSIKGKNGGSARAIADAEAYVTIFAVPTGEYAYNLTPSIKAVPGTVILSKRVQELSATLAGVIQTCTDTGDGTIDVLTECTVTDEEIGLMQDTTAAHHFNFVLPDMNSGEYDIVAVFTTGANAEVDICTTLADCAVYDADDAVGTVSGSAEATVVINKTMMTIQQVRAVKGSIGDGTDTVVINVDTQVCTVNDVVVDCPTEGPLTP
jgi:hypothetical protein